MVEDNKYYVPESNEFHIGFEYEYRQVDDWIKEIFQYNDCMSDFRDTDGYRVKYLDKSDIESLGWEYHKPWIRESEGLIFINNMYGLTWFKKTNSFCIWEKLQSDCEGEFYFQGKIKNKSELSKIMKMLSIK